MPVAAAPAVVLDNEILAKVDPNQASELVKEKITRLSKWKLVERKFLPTFLFSERDAIVALGQDGLVANTAKYVRSLPVLGVNPDARRYDGVLLPFLPNNFEQGLIHVLENTYRSNLVTMAQATTHDGQSLLAFNDKFI